MSRIDQALRSLEDAGVGPSRSPGRSHANASLSDYPVESGERVRAEPSPLQPIEPIPAPKAAVKARDAYLAARLVEAGSNSVSLEQYRRLAAILHDAQVHGQLRAVMVTSALPGEGKSLTIANLAYTLSG